MVQMLSAVKKVLAPAGRKTRTIPFGLLSGVKYGIDLSNGTQTFLGLSEIELAPWFRRLSRGVRSALDVGAAEGFYTLFWLTKTSAQKVIAFEPMAMELGRLRENARANGFLESPRLEIVAKFVGGTSDADHVNLDAYAPRLEFPCIVKLDIEGGELDALHGAKELVTAGRDVRFIIEAHSRDLETECSKLLSSRGFRVTEVGKSPIRRLLPEQRPAEYNSWIVAERA